MLRRLPDMAEQGVRDTGQQLGLHPGRGIAVLDPHKDPVQEDGAAVPRPPQGKQDGQGSGGQRRGYIGLKADLPHDQIGGDRPVGQLPGDLLVVVVDGVGDEQSRAVGAERAPLRQEGGQPGSRFAK